MESQESAQLGLSLEIFCLAAPRLLDCARPIGRLASVSRDCRRALTDTAGLLRVGSLNTIRLHCVKEGLPRLSPSELEVLRIDLSAESREHLCRKDVEHAVRQLSDCLASADHLRVLAVKLASFDISMDRLRLSREAWEALIRGLSALARHQRLRSLELSSIAMKASQATQAVTVQERHLRRAASAPDPGSYPAPTSSLTFLDVLARLSALEELSLTYNEIFGATAKLLPPVFSELVNLRRVDLTRNHIPKQVMREVRQALPAKIQLQGDDQQTFFFY